MFALPWSRHTVPHAVIELTRECNLACRACYRQKSAGMRSVAEILDDVRTIERHQRVHTLSLAGGEPTLHPELVDIVRAVKGRVHRVSLVTNALLLSDHLLAALRSAGLDIVMIHVDEGQQRPDLPAGAGAGAINRLREVIAGRVHAHGIAVGLCTTLYPESLARLSELFSLFLCNPHINFLFATHAVTIPDVVARAQQKAGGGALTGCGTSNGSVMKEMRRLFNLEPYAFIPPVRQSEDGELPCITYSVPVAHRQPPAFLRMESGVADRLLVKLSRLLAGRYVYFTPASRAAALVQILFNGACSGHLLRAVKFLFGAAGSPLLVKRLVFENAPRITPEGVVNCCDFCPNSTVREGRVVPVCLADHRQELSL